MSNKLVLKTAFLGAVIAFFSALYMGFGIPVPEKGMVLQPSYPIYSAAEFLRPANQYPDLTLRFFTGDSFFILGYLIVFIGLYTITAKRSLVFARLGFGAGILTAALDITENSFFITYAQLAKSGHPVTDPALPAVFIIANLKWMCAYAALALMGLIWPRKNALDWAVSAIMLLFPLIGILATVWAPLLTLRVLFFLVGMLLFAACFWRRLKLNEA